MTTVSKEALAELRAAGSVLIGVDDYQGMLLAEQIERDSGIETVLVRHKNVGACNDKIVERASQKE